MHVQRKETRFRGRPRIDGLWGPVVCRTQGLGRSGIAARKRESTSRKHRVTLATLDRFLAGGEACLKSRETDVEDEKKTAPRLSLSHVINGSLFEAGRRCQVTINLIHAQHGTQLWARQYEFPVGEILTILLK